MTTNYRVFKLYYVNTHRTLFVDATKLRLCNTLTKIIFFSDVKKCNRKYTHIFDKHGMDTLAIKIN